jgi:hypothetical protein
MITLGKYLAAIAALVAVIAFCAWLTGCGPAFTADEVDAGDVVHLEATPAADAGAVDAVDAQADGKGEDSSVRPFADAALERDAGEPREAAAPVDSSSSSEDQDAGEPPTSDAGRVPCTVLSGCPRCGNVDEQACCRSDQTCGCAFLAGQCQ